ncbi:MAG: ADP-glyceromanno-heptose 6-epimerase [Candidatus Aenigmarchaeota archaeon]|nr:ADP-glyceromanno-heptose 6-epimerase [Candidatus Aenigmarchaeota archaeon]
MKIIVTGGAGFIGSNIARELEKQHNVVVLDDFTHTKKENLENFSGDVIKADITSFEWNSVSDVDVIFHEAAITDTTIQTNRVIDVNFSAFKTLLACAIKNNTDVIYASSAAVYGNGNVPMREDQKLSPNNIYGKSKMMMDVYAQDIMKKQKIKIIGLRYFNVFGPGEQFKGSSANMVYQIYCQMLQGNPRLFKFGEQKRDFVYIKDVMHANILALRSKASGIFNVGTGTATSFNAIVDIINTTLETHRTPEYFDNPFRFTQDETCADLTRVRDVLGYEPRYTTQQGIEEYVGVLQKKFS